jgi:hypothetical protein
MNIQTVATNLRNTIKGKEQMLEAVMKERTFVGLRDGEDIALRTTAQFLKINLDELYEILKDVESCIAKDVEQSWRDDPDRSGGQFTQEEIDNANRW